MEELVVKVFFVFVDACAFAFVRNARRRVRLD